MKCTFRRGDGTTFEAPLLQQELAEVAAATKRTAAKLAGACATSTPFGIRQKGNVKAMPFNDFLTHWSCAALALADAKLGKADAAASEVQVFLSERRTTLEMLAGFKYEELGAFCKEKGIKVTFQDSVDVFPVDKKIVDFLILSICNGSGLFCHRRYFLTYASGQLQVGGLAVIVTSWPVLVHTYTCEMLLIFQSACKSSA